MHTKFEDLREYLCGELDKVAKKEDMNMSDLELVDKLTHAIKNLDKVMLGNEMIKEYGYSFANEYSQRGDYSQRGRRGRDGDNDGRYNESRERSYDSYATTTSNRGNGSYDSYGYSGHNDASVRRFKEMMQEALHEL